MFFFFLLGLARGNNFFRMKSQLATLDDNIASLKEQQRLAKERMEKAAAQGGMVDEKKLRESEVSQGLSRHCLMPSLS